MAIALNQNDVYQNIREIILTARCGIKKAVDFSMVQAYWQIGKQIMEAQGGENRAEYGAPLLKFLSERLTVESGVSFDETNLRKMRQFYSVFQIRDTLCPELSWSHYRRIMRIPSASEREFYIKECAACNWSVRQLERQINTLYHKRLLASTDKDIVRNEIQTLEPKEMRDYILKDPYLLEFLELKENKKHHEKEIEQALLDNLQEFLLELGKGFSFVGRQKRITLDGDHFYIDLVFYNYILRCFVVIDLKTGKLTPQDIGQLDFYVRYFDDKIRQEGDNPTIGLILCADKNESVAKYSVLNDNKNLFTSKYLTYLPTELELKTIIDEVKEITAESNKSEKP
ncbi:MAG: PDDEXK nuclease domain-containing protein [Nitrososphaerota archaeon]|jgi:predicted nuclease of restriction endonuclease-like (RecB) superfamily|nr:PDDEXK nuclease domain-containing protein [Nitrososphaerota archaeon]